jgi:regulatory protein
VRRRKPKPAVQAAPDDQGAARLAALRLLNRRDYGVRELETRLLERGFDMPTTRAAVAALEREKLLDDTRFAQHFVAYHAGRGRGPIGIAHRLREAGVAAAEIAAAVDESDGSWRRLCAEVRRKRFGAQAPSTWAERGRQARFLAQRGFNAEQVRAAVGGEIEEE